MKGSNMTPEEINKQLAEEHKKAMEAINAFNKAAKDAVQEGKGMMGL